MRTSVGRGQPLRPARCSRSPHPSVIGRALPLLRYRSSHRTSFRMSKPVLGVVGRREARSGWGINQDQAGLVGDTSHGWARHWVTDVVQGRPRLCVGVTEHHTAPARAVGIAEKRTSFAVSGRHRLRSTVFHSQIHTVGHRKPGPCDLQTRRTGFQRGHRRWPGVRFGRMPASAVPEALQTPSRGFLSSRNFVS